MDNYNLQPDEVVLFDDDIYFLRGSKGSNHITLTNQNLVIVNTERKVFKKGEVTTTVFPVTDIKVYKGAPQVQQKMEKVTVFLTSGELDFSFESLFKATKFVAKVTELITGKGMASRGAGKVKSAIGLVDDTLGIDTMGTISGVLENGIGKTLLKGFGGSAAKIAKATGKAETIAAVATGATSIIQAASGNSTPETAPAAVQAELSYEQRVESVKKLKELVDMGILSAEEFEAKKKEILGL